MQFRPKMFVAKTKAKLLPRSRPPAGPVRLTGWARWKMRCNAARALDSQGKEAECMDTVRNAKELLGQRPQT